MDPGKHVVGSGGQVSALGGPVSFFSVEAPIGNMVEAAGLDGVERGGEGWGEITADLRPCFLRTPKKTET